MGYGCKSFSRWLTFCVCLSHLFPSVLYLSVRLSPSSYQSFLSAFSLCLFLRLSLLFASVRLLVRLSLFPPVFGVCISLSVSLPVFVRQVFSVRLFPCLSSVRHCLLVRLSIHPSPRLPHPPPPTHTHTQPCIPSSVIPFPPPSLKRKEKRRQASSVL